MSPVKGIVVANRIGNICLGSSVNICSIAEFLFYTAIIMSVLILRKARVLVQLCWHNLINRFLCDCTTKLLNQNDQ